MKEGKVVCIFCKNHLNVCEWDGHFCESSALTLSPEVVDMHVHGASAIHDLPSPVSSTSGSDVECLPVVGVTRLAITILT